MSDPDDPACLSWPVPPLRELSAELDAMAAVLAQGPPEEHLSGDALKLIYRSPEVLRWAEFHSGVRMGEHPLALVRCAICGRARSAGVVDDYDRLSGLVRGILCTYCKR